MALLYENGRCMLKPNIFLIPSTGSRYTKPEKKSKSLICIVYNRYPQTKEQTI